MGEYAEWYRICKSFYEVENTDGKSVIEFFDSIAPGRTDVQTSVIIDREIQLMIKNCCISNAEKDPELWFKLNDMKNKARSDAHKSLMEMRLSKVESLSNQLCNDIYTEVNTYDRSTTNLRRLASYRYDESLTNFFGGLHKWMILQRESSFCVRWNINATTFTERSESFRDNALHAFCSLAKFINRTGEEFTWEFRDNYSNLYLNRLLRIIPHCKGENFILGTLEQSATKRNNINGELEDYPTYICNQLQCPIL
eukprot:gene3748-7442_t